MSIRHDTEDEIRGAAGGYVAEFLLERLLGDTDNREDFLVSFGGWELKELLMEDVDEEKIAAILEDEVKAIARNLSK